MERITHKQDGSEFDPETDLAQQVIDDGAEEIVRPGAFEERLVAIRTTPFAFPAQELLRVDSGTFEEIAKPTGLAVRWFRYPVIDEQDTVAVFEGTGLASEADGPYEPLAGTEVTGLETSGPEYLVVDDAPEMAPVDEERTET